ncbi:MAG: ferritin [Spirochaetia bacterium]|nr:ferritin [Spirochaetia bacterium]
MIGKKMEDALNKQVNAEFYSEFLYLSMSADFASKTFDGFAQWFKVQAEEENSHAMKFYKHIIERGGKVRLAEIAAPKLSWKTPLEAAEDAYAHEQKVTAMINKLVETAQEEKDYAALEMLQWFVKEQVEEEANSSKMTEQLKMIGESVGGIFQIDHILGKRKNG